jgi:LPXTG-motif cell wall anchor domain protein
LPNTGTASSSLGFIGAFVGLLGLASLKRKHD